MTHLTVENLQQIFKRRQELTDILYSDPFNIVADTELYLLDLLVEPLKSLETLICQD